MPVLDGAGHYPDTSIELRTRNNAKIDNVQVWEYSRLEWNQLADTLKRFQNVERVSDACPVYNCHGLTFGSRRTQVTHQITPILDDDGFEKVTEKDARTGDIVVYLSDRGEVSHSGFVVGRKEIEIITGSKITLPIVWSKWGKGYEMVHPVGHCPYVEYGGTVTYYRLQRWKP